MFFEIDVSGEDILNENYTVVVAEPGKNTLMLGYKFDEKTLRILTARWGQGKYTYAKSPKGKADMRVRLYCIVIYYIFKRLKDKIESSNIKLRLCKDFSGRESNIKESLKYLLSSLKYSVASMDFAKLSKHSLADKYAYLLRKDTENKFKGLLIHIEIDEFEKFLKY
ncbi:MAG TPA: hypothetical protein VJG83_02410 [archaeon]|nr:hypothetical protein [archaeon]